ncbi:UDP-glucose flavonoid 3-O-glucosyltransferase 7-like isoform X1 [Prunus yedoensis var. nudiflora]|uniref:UDP-glucose flavonoid 3-O-glucosyltransferase 7-like isoform X1 n=1 Tax=Prunus yedoensis var. nudiflora TaxID=2094558 RepID=A0A314YU11_PRUYE|nr:UDP-glucose flavonoid 3-O-glucosyltransferase 7-like isoform X1 [Prunus yedoensis var. nudiflora]
METKSHEQLHIFFFPFMAQGHSIPLIDIAKLFASRGVKSTLITTPLNAPLLSKAIQISKNLGFDIEILVIRFPTEEVGLPQGFEITSMATTREMKEKFYQATFLLEPQIEQILDQHRPHCLVADSFFPWSTDVAAKFGIPRLIFYGPGFFPLCASLSVILYKPHLKVSSDSEVFTIPNLPVEIKITRNQVPTFDQNANPFLSKLLKETWECEERSYGIIVNTFYELEPAFADHYRKVFGRKAWHLGPVSLCNKAAGDKTEMRGMEASLDEHECLNWLNTKKHNSVVYICFGSLTNFSDPQLLEIALGLEASGKEFIWVVRREKKEKEEWLPEGFEQRMEGVSSGVPMITWPVSAEQFYNEKLATEILRIGVTVGSKKWASLVEVKKEASVKRDAIEKAVAQVMVGDEAEEMRSRARALGEMARRAVEEGGSSFSDLTALIEELRSL